MGCFFFSHKLDFFVEHIFSSAFSGIIRLTLANVHISGFVLVLSACYGDRRENWLWKIDFKVETQLNNQAILFLRLNMSKWILLKQDHRMVQLEGTLKTTMFQPMLSVGTPPTRSGCTNLRTAGLEHYQGWHIHRFSGQPVGVFNHYHSEEFISNIYCKSTLSQFKVIVILLCSLLKCPSLCFQWLPFMYCTAAIRSPWTLLF